MNTIDAKELKAALDDVVLLDVLPGDAWEEWRLPGAKNACVYEMTFLEQVEKAGVTKDARVVVYCSGPESLASQDACERLEAAGYGNVVRFAGGRQAWQEAGYAPEGSAADGPWVPRPSRHLFDGDHAMDPEKSRIHWVGRNVGGRHDGTLAVSSGTLRVEDGRATGGALEIDMASIEVLDLKGDMAALLKTHLEHEDFFAVARFPTARLELSRLMAIEGADAGQPNHAVAAELTLRGRTCDLEFPATIAPHREGGIEVEAHFDVDRTRWGASYGSGKLYHRLGMHMVDDNVTIEARLRTA